MLGKHNKEWKEEMEISINQKDFKQEMENL